VNSDELQRAFGFLWPVEPAVLRHLAHQLPPNPVVINIGAGVGTSGLAFMEARDDLELFTVDIQDAATPFGGLENERTVFHQAGLLGDPRHHQVHLDSAEMGNGWADAPVDLVFVDGDHTTEGVLRDIDAWLPRLRPGGIIAFHDVGERWWYGYVKNAIDQRRDLFSDEVCRISLIQAFYTKADEKRLLPAVHRIQTGGPQGQDLSFVAYYPAMAGWLTTAEPETWAWAEKAIGQDWLCIDAGAHAGMYTMLFAQKASKGTVIAIEACPATREMLRANLAYNARMNYRHLGHVRLLRKAIGNRTGRFADRLWYTGQEPSDEVHDFVRLDEWGAFLPRLDLLKTDVDGWDFDALQGAEGLIKRFKPIILSEVNYALEWRGHKTSDVQELLNAWGYSHRVLDRENWLCWPTDDAEKAALCNP
jgi:FkbM family methyltransferase